MRGFQRCMVCPDMATLKFEPYLNPTLKTWKRPGRHDMCWEVTIMKCEEEWHPVDRGGCHSVTVSQTVTDYVCHTVDDMWQLVKVFTRLRVRWSIVPDNWHVTDSHTCWCTVTLGPEWMDPQIRRWEMAQKNEKIELYMTVLVPSCESGAKR